YIRRPASSYASCICVNDG
ncbi:EAST1 family heat-stable enterotoxin, partial [Escherichia coli]|nr:EAST1 family heat-stable enterotoxin [Escherichia coli]